ncbi:unnamed protein product [Brugia pahangi]|uniref:Secreted protein n=1 Tax=Brugia pahangi TaxID=6280 RepID=A0A0N4T2N9_BRUPA|nr:unnamed protein product [Brugia pahangi]
MEIIMHFPPSSALGSIIVYFLSVKAEYNQYVTINSIRSTSSCSCKHTVQVGEMLAFSSSRESIRLWAHNLHIRHMPTAKGSNIFECLMPSSLPVMYLKCIFQLSLHDQRNQYVSIP